MATHVLTRFCTQSRVCLLSTNYCHQLIRFESDKSHKQTDEVLLEEDNEFRTLEILPKKEERIRRKPFSISGDIMSPRYKRMATDQDWPTVWPTARVFHPATVPLPLHMGYTSEDQPRAPPSKFNNPELMKIPNFLHLTPPAIKRQCEALKQFCTQWPKGLETDEKCDKHFPIQIKTEDFVFSNTSIRWPKYRVVELKVKLSDLPLDYHAIDKMKRLLMEKYDEKTDTINITASRCPMRKQNYDYAMYLLTAVFFESWKTEVWESEKSESDWEKYYWDKSKSKETVVKYMKHISPDSTEEEILKNHKIKSYAEAVSKLIDEKENKTNLDNYKQSVLQLLF